MEPLRDFSGLTRKLRTQNIRKRVVVVSPNDPHTEYVISRALQEGIADFLLVSDAKHIQNSLYIQDVFPENVNVVKVPNAEDAAREAVSIVKHGSADILMKGLINTDELLRAVLDKENGILPKGNVLSHVTLSQIPLYNKFLLFSDAAVIPKPTLEQLDSMIRYDIEICHKLGINEPRIALINSSEKVNPKFPHTLDYVTIKERAKNGEYGSVFIDGPMDVKTACDSHSAEVKGISSPVVGHSDLLIFPNIESGNTFYKAISLFGDANVAGMLTGTTVPVVVPSRADSGNSKYYSLILACATG